jgi:nitrite reductase (NO-forming)
MSGQSIKPVSRRSFLKVAGIAAGAAAGTALASGCAVPVVQSSAQQAPKADAQAGAMTDHAAVGQATGAAVNIPPHQVYDARVPAVDSNPVKAVHWNSSDVPVYIADGIGFQAWTFGGTVPGPLLVVNEGDTVQFSLTNQSMTTHSIDFHAAQTPPSKNYIAIQPQATHKFDWQAQYPGCFMYHCGTPFVLHHMAMGMYGATIVRPKTGLRPAAREYALVQSEFYLTAPDNGVSQTDLTKALTGIPDYVAFNGYANQYQATPLTAKVGELVRLWVLNAGPTHFSAFHIIGTIFEAAYQDGNPANKMVGMQTVSVYPGGGMMVEFTIPEAGDYPFVSHSFADASKGALGVLTVTNS